MTPEPDVVLGGRYLLIRRIAVGGMGEVWEATDELLARPVAVKILKEEFRTASTFLERFRAEARHAGQLSHSGIATVYDYGETPDRAFLVMELVRGRPLSELMADQQALTFMAKLSILAQAAEALHAAHRAGVVHRDVKPGNLMVRDDGAVKVTDFGIARALTSAALTEDGQMIGTPAYVSPEQATGDRVTGASDVYSLGVVAYELFAGHPPFERDTSLALALAHVNDPPPPLPASVPRGVAELIESALAKDPSARPPSAAHFAAQVRREMATTMEPAPTPVPPAGQDRRAGPTTVSPSSRAPAEHRGSTLLTPTSDRREVRRHSYVVAAFAALLVLVAATIWVGTRPTTFGDARPEPAADPTVSGTAVATDAPTATQPPATQTPATQAPATQTPATQTPATQPPSTPPPDTGAPATEPPSTEPPSTEPPSTEAPPADVAADPTTPAAESAEGRRVADGEAVAFVVDYYERLAAGDYATTWEALSPEFREARDLTFESYVSYWENTTIELRDPRSVAGTGDDERRVRFDARYDTGTRVVDETDEITLRRDADGNLIITDQRTV